MKITIISSLFLIFAFFKTGVKAVIKQHPEGQVFYTDDGVLRVDQKCNITFVNFGTDYYIYKRAIKQIYDSTNTSFNLTISELTNGNIGINYQSNVTMEELHDLIKIKQNNVEITDYEITTMRYSKGNFDLKINNLSTCDGLIIKQTFKEKYAIVSNRLYYKNTVPQTINQSFNSGDFGPPLSYPFHRLNWDFNAGLDDLRETCGIYIDYDGLVNTNSDHWKYYLSVDSVNTKRCSVLEFFEIVKKHYIDYEFCEELFGKNYVGYVFKREGHIDVHMDGVLMDINYSVEVFQKECGNNIFTDQLICTITSDEPLSFKNFTTRLFNECLKINVNDEDQKWSISDSVATGELDGQIITVKKIDKDQKGSLPSKVDGDINYSTASSGTVRLARFLVEFNCNDGHYLNDNCKCQACPLNCEICTGPKACTKCKGNDETTTLVNGRCFSKPGYFEDVNGNHVICKEECKTCDVNGCITCKDDKKEIDGNGGCKCIKGYYLDNNECVKCNDECSECANGNSCIACNKPNKVPVGKKNNDEL